MYLSIDHDTNSVGLAQAHPKRGKLISKLHHNYRNYHTSVCIILVDSTQQTLFLISKFLMVHTY